MHDERHYEYHIQTGKTMTASTTDVVVHANNVPWTIMLHGTLLVRLLTNPALRSLVVVDAPPFGPLRALSAIMWPGLPQNVKSKIAFA